MQGEKLRKHIDATLGSGKLREAVRLPPGEDLHEWMAINSQNFHPYGYRMSLQIFNFISSLL